MYVGDYLLLDSDIIWFKETKMIAGHNETTGTIYLSKYLSI
jgi:hypothetical protein